MGYFLPVNPSTKRSSM
ncbi:hypothetical protein MTR67_048551 [Solanum verrucosum]|uniref:Uncharacterized protein n=1 Tax=Solanum verrucosum TaxID=315347 RepID=A0AAF0V1U0_SOLVR|nr:hypothetical protein MTR67_048551 [Solanum verrucosum]